MNIITGDITHMKVDAIVNAANSSLLGGGGVDGVIHRAAGGSLLDECRELRRTRYKDGLSAGESVSTGGGNLFAKYVIHTVGPVWKGGSFGEEFLLRNCYINSLSLADELCCHSIAFPAISTGVYGYPKDLAAIVSSRAIHDYIEKSGSEIKITLVFFSERDRKIFEKSANM